MDAIKKLSKSLQKLEDVAKQALATAAAEGRFEEIVDLAEIAKDVSELARRWSSSDVQDADTSSVQATSGKQPERQVARQTRREFPKFIRERDDLVKIGWSAKERKPYEHRAPKSTVDAVARIVAAKGKLGHRFTMDDVMKSLTLANGNGVTPSYQVYAAMLWLKWSGMLLQHGRQGYTIIRPQTFQNSVQTAWQSLPKR